MKLARRALDDPDRIKELQDELDRRVVDLLAEATDAGYSSHEVLEALGGVCSRQRNALDEDPDPADDPS